ncbi:SIR2-like domain [Carpediemonas membranifera]|uniref:SIR2-like domain n=1 Tax=Carpediemonas membranifera TaxID=201153 RepID=A0A8J6ARS3_9EUKA|nr:SIR2-like domain [Carpediemonas membranifera]|eukprot:KAG9392671.1 SIR2-like domain [Carpediemonas membranifera]
MVRGVVVVNDEQSQAYTQRFTQEYTQQWFPSQAMPNEPTTTANIQNWIGLATESSYLVDERYEAFINNIPASIGAREALLGLIGAMRCEDSVVPFIGAGVSCAVGYEGWWSLLNRTAGTLDAKTCADVRESLAADAFLEAADKLDAAVPGGMSAVIKETFGPKPDMAQALGGLLPSFTGPVVTTNYDPVVESVLGVGPACVILPTTGQDEAIRALGLGQVVVKIHGTFDVPSSHILTKRSYDCAYLADGKPDWTKPIPCIVQSLNAYRSLLFIGCSLVADEYLTWLAPTSARRSHYALLPYPGDDAVEARLSFLRALNIEPVWYPSGGDWGRHAYLQTVLAYALSEAAVASPEPSSTQAVLSFDAQNLVRSAWAHSIFSRLQPAFDLYSQALSVIVDEKAVPDLELFSKCKLGLAASAKALGHRDQARALVTELLTVDTLARTTVVEACWLLAELSYPDRCEEALHALYGAMASITAETWGSEARAVGKLVEKLRLTVNEC